jgi:hypothetical protein
MTTRVLFTLRCLISSAIFAAGCGGGGQTQVAITPGGGGSGTVNLTIGAVSGFGSVFVNGVRYDNNQTQLIVEDGDDDGAGLKLGNVVRLEGKINGDKLTGKADKIEMSAEIKGPVDSKLSTTSFVAMGATVKTDASTLFENVAADLSNLAVGDIVQVHGLPDGTGVVLASRVQKRTQTTLPVYKTIGVVAPTPAPTATQFKLGALTVNYSAAVVRDVPTPLPVGAIVRVKTTALPAAGVITASQVRPFVAGPQVGAVDAEIKGFITDFSASSFKVNGLTVSITAATTYERGAATDLANGRNVEVEGAVGAGGVITARTIKFEDVPGGGQDFRFEGPVTDFVSTSDFKVKGQRIDASQNPQVSPGGRTVAEIANGVNVEVRGAQIVNDKLVATRVQFK